MPRKKGDPNETKSKSVSIKVTPPDLEILDGIARASKRKRADVARLLYQKGLDLVRRGEPLVAADVETMAAAPAKKPDLRHGGNRRLKQGPNVHNVVPVSSRAVNAPRVGILTTQELEKRK